MLLEECSASSGLSRHAFMMINIILLFRENNLLEQQNNAEVFKGNTLSNG